MTETKLSYSYATTKLYRNLVLRGIMLIIAKLYGADMSDDALTFRRDVESYTNTVDELETNHGLGRYKG